MTGPWDSFGPPAQPVESGSPWEAFAATPSHPSERFTGSGDRAAPAPQKDFWDTVDVVSSVWDAVKGLGVTAPAAFYQLTEGLERPDQYSDSAKRAFEEADSYALEMQAKTTANQQAGKSSSVGESLREAGQSLGFSLGSMAAAIPAGIAGAKVGAPTGAAIATAAGFAGPQALLPEELVTVPVGAGLGALIGGGLAAGAASGGAAYRMAGASFLNEAFQAQEREKGAPLTEKEKADAYEVLLPIAKNSALWEAGPEAVGNAVSLGAGKLIFGKGITKTLEKWGMKKASALTTKSGGKLAVRSAAGLAAVGTELATETLTQVEQSADHLKSQALAEGGDMEAIKADWSPGGMADAFQEIMPQTLALLGLMGGGAASVKTTIKGAKKGVEKLQSAGLFQTAAQIESLAINDAIDFAATQQGSALPAMSPAGIQGLATSERAELQARADSLSEDEQGRLQALDSLFEGDVFDAEAAAPLVGASVSQLAKQREANVPKPAPAAPKPTSTPSSFKLGEATLATADTSPQAQLAAVFGPAPKGEQYDGAGRDPTQLAVRKDGQITYAGEPTQRAVVDGVVVKRRPKDKFGSPEFGRADSDFRQAIPKVEEKAEAPAPVASAPPAAPAAAAPTRISPKTLATVSEEELEAMAAWTKIPGDLSSSNTDKATQRAMAIKEIRERKERGLWNNEPNAPVTAAGTSPKAESTERKTVVDPVTGSVSLVNPDGSSIEETLAEFWEGKDKSTPSAPAVAAAAAKPSPASTGAPKASLPTDPAASVKAEAAAPEGGTSQSAPSLTPVVASTQPATPVAASPPQTSSVEDLERELIAFMDDAQENGETGTEFYRMERDRLKEEIAKARKGPSLSAPGGPSAATVRSEARVDEQEVHRAVKGERGGLGEVTGDDTALGVLEVGMPVVATDQFGEATNVRVVISTAVDEQGRRVHTLSRQINDSEALDESAYRLARIPPTEKESAAALRVAESLLSAAPDAQRIHQTVAVLLQGVLGRVAGRQFAEQTFSTTTDNIAGVASGGKIQANPDVWSRRLRSSLRGVSLNSPVADSILEDWLSEMESTMWHEARHNFLLTELGKNQPVVMRAMNALLQNAANNPASAAMLGQAARGRYAHSENFQGALSNIADAEVLALLAGETVRGVTLTPQQVLDETFALGAEFDALFIQNLHSGMDPAAVRAAADRFIERAVGDPTSSSPGKIAVLVERLAELLRRGLEASARFMRAHRLAATLPTEFLQLSLTLDQLMKGEGIVAPDPTRVVERFSRSAAQRMADVAAVEERLKSREWFDNGERLTEFEVKAAVREISTLAKDKEPDFRPVRFDRVTGQLKPHPSLARLVGADSAKLMADMLDRLNDPRRSAMALEAREVAADTRLVLRHLNFGAPVMAETFPGRERPADESGAIARALDPTFNQDLLNIGDFETAAAILDENLITEVEARTGFPVQAILDQINRSLVNAQAPVPPANLRAVRNVMETVGHRAYDKLQAEWAKLDAGALTLEQEARPLAPDDVRRAKLIARAGTMRERMLVIRYKQDLLLNHAENYQAPKEVLEMDRDLVSRAEFVRDSLRAARIRQTRAEIAHRAAEANYRQRAATLRDFGDLANAGYDVEQLTGLLSETLNGEPLLPGIDIQQLHAVLGRAEAARRAFARLSLLPAELEFMLLGGPKPVSMRDGRRESAWTPFMQVALAEDKRRELLPTNAAGVLWRSRVAGFAPDAVTTSVTVVTPDLGPLPFAPGSDFADSPADAQAKAVESATLASARLVGYELADKSAYEQADEMKRGAIYRRNMTVLAKGLVGRMRRAMIGGDPAVTSSTLERGGFPLLSGLDFEGNVVGVLSPTLMPLPSRPAWRTQEEGGFVESMKDLLDGGFAAESILSAAGFMDRMAGDGVHSPALPHHTDGMSPAGVAHAILTPRFLRLLALTKGTNFQARMRASLKNDAQRLEFDGAFDSLAAGLEATPTYRALRDGNNYEGVVNSAVHNLFEGMVMGDALYKESIKEAAFLSRRGSDPAKEGVTDESRSPLDEELLRDHRFNQSQISRAAQSRRLLGEASEQSLVAISALRPVAASESLVQLDQIENERQKMVRVGRDIDRGKVTEWSEVRMIFEGDDRQSDTDREPQSDQMSNAGKQWLLDNLRRHDELLLEREEKVITQLMLSLYGGDEAAVRRVLNSNAFAYSAKVGGRATESEVALLNRSRDTVDDYGNSTRVVGYDPRTETLKHTEGGVATLHWDRTAIRNFIRGELERMRAEEVARGVIHGVDANGNNAAFDGAMQGLIERHPAHAAMLRQITLTRGVIHSGTAPTAFAAETFGATEGRLDARYDADATSILFALLGKIGNVTILTGRMDHSARYGDADTRVPSLAFIPDPANPMLVLPFGRMEPTTEEATLAIEATLEWLGQHGGVDFAEISRPIVEQISLLADPRLLEVRSHYRDMLATHMEKLGNRVISQEDRDALLQDRDNPGAATRTLKKYGVTDPNKLITQLEWDARIEEWVRSVSGRIRMLKEDSGLNDLLDPSFVAAIQSGVDFTKANLDGWTTSSVNEAYRKIFARLLTNSAAKELFIYTTFKEGAPVPSLMEQAAFGDLIGFSSVRGVDMMALRDEALHLADIGQVVTDSIGRDALRQRSAEQGGGVGDANLAVLDQAGALIAESESEFNLPPVVPMQAEWANAMFYEALRSTTPRRDPLVPLEGQQPAKGLTEYQARQLLMVFGAELEEGGRPLTVDDVVNSTGARAARLQARFSQGWAHAGIVPNSDSNIAPAREQAEKYGSYSLLDPLTGKHRTWEGNRVQKGALLFAELAGVKFERREGEFADNASRHASVVPDLAAWQAALSAQRMLKNTLTTLDAAGRPLAGPPEQVDAFEAARREVFGENAANRAFIEATTARAQQLLGRHRELSEALEATQQLIDDQYESAEAMASGLTGSAPARLARRAISRFTSARENTATDLARDMVRRFEGVNVGSNLLGDPFSPSAGAIIHPGNPLVMSLREIRRRYDRRYRDLSLGISESGDLTRESFLFSPRYSDHNQRAETLFSELEELSPDNFRGNERRSYMLEIGMPAQEAERRIANLTGFVNQLDNPEWLRARISRGVTSRVTASPLSVASEIRPPGRDLTESPDQISLSAEAQELATGILYDGGFRPGARLTAEQRQSLVDALAPIIFNDLYRGSDTLEDSRSAARAALATLMDGARQQKVKSASDVLGVLIALGDSGRTDPLFAEEVSPSGLGLESPLVRNRAIAKLLRGNLRELASRSGNEIQATLQQLQMAAMPRARIAAFRTVGHRSLLLKPGTVNGRRVDATDVEIARRVLESYGLMWSRLYMRRYGKSEFEVGVVASERAALAADQAAEAGFGNMLTPTYAQRFRLVDSILEPENLLERVQAVSAARTVRSAPPKIVVARLRRDARRLASLSEKMDFPEALASFRHRALEKVGLAPAKLKPGGEELKGPRLSLQGSEESIESIIARIKLGDYSKKEVKSFLDNAIESTQAEVAVLQKEIPNKEEFREFLSSPSNRAAQSALDAINEKRADVKALRRRLRQLSQRLEEYEAGLLVENEGPTVSLFSPVSATAAEQEIAFRVNQVMEGFNQPPPLSKRSRQQASAQAQVARSGADIYGGLSPDQVTRNQLRFQLAEAMRIQRSGELKGFKDGETLDLHDSLTAVLQELQGDPGSVTNQAAFHRVQALAISAMFAKDKTETWATGYLHKKSHAEEGYFYRALLHESAKVAGVFAGSLEAQASANEVRSILDKGSDGLGGKDRYRSLGELNRAKVAEVLAAMDKKNRYETASRGMLLAQVGSHMSAHGNNVSAAKGVLAILQAAESAMSRANLLSSGGPEATTLLGKGARKGRQLWNLLHERGHHQLDNQKVMLAMFDRVIPALEQAIENESDLEAESLVGALRKEWGKEASGYADLLSGLFHEQRKGLENVLVMRGVPAAELANKALVPFVWSSVTRESYTSSEVKSMADLLNPAKAAWMGSPFRTWKDDGHFDLLDFDGMTAPLRVMDDMIYRTMMAPAYDSVAAIVGDVSVSSDHFSQYALDENGQPKSGYIVEMAKRQEEAGNLTHHQFMKARSGALAMANMIRDELINDMMGFSASSRIISFYRKMAITGLARKLFSFSQPVAQTVSPLVGYVAANGARGRRFMPLLTRYLTGIAPGSKGNDFAAQVQAFVNKLAQAVAHRAADSNQMLREVMEDARPDSKTLRRSPLLGAAAPALRLAGKANDLMAKGSAKTLELLIAKPEGWVIKPMLVHETLEELNAGRAVKVTMEAMLADPMAAGVLPRHIQAATVRVEQLFGTADRSQKGKASQPAKTLREDILRSLLTTLAGHPISMAANSWAAWRMLGANPVGSPEFKEGLRILGQTVGQNMVFVFFTAPTVTYLLSSVLAAMFDWDEDERQEWEGSLYGIDVDDDPAERRTKLSYWAMAMLGRNEDPYGYAWHQNAWTDEQEAKHAGYRYARIVKELVNQAPVIGSLSSTTLGGSLIDAGLKAADISPQSSVKQAGVILPDKWGFSGTAAEPDDDTPYSERAIYLATKFWFNYLNDSNAAAFALDPLMQSMKYAANNPEDMDAMDALMIGATLFANKPREVDRAVQRHYPAVNPEFIPLAPWEAR